MRISGLIVIALAAALAPRPGSANPDTFICSGGTALGFRFHEPTADWIRGQFEPGSFVVGWESGSYSLKKLHSDITATCSLSMQNPAELVCQRTGSFTFRFNLETRRYLFSYQLGYVNGDEHAETPYTEIGECLVFE